MKWGDINQVCSLTCVMGGVGAVMGLCACEVGVGCVNTFLAIHERVHLSDATVFFNPNLYPNF